LHRWKPSEKCQREHWSAGHNMRCNAPPPRTENIPAHAPPPASAAESYVSEREMMEREKVFPEDNHEVVPYQTWEELLALLNEPTTLDTSATPTPRWLLEPCAACGAPQREEVCERHGIREGGAGGVMAFRRCKRCKTLYYCSDACQRNHWSRVHKLHCRILADIANGGTREERRAMGGGGEGDNRIAPPLYVDVDQWESTKTRAASLALHRKIDADKERMRKTQTPTPSQPQPQPSTQTQTQTQSQIQIQTQTQSQTKTETENSKRGSKAERDRKVLRKRRGAREEERLKERQAKVEMHEQVCALLLRACLCLCLFSER
jgi:hypothetical protein